MTDNLTYLTGLAEALATDEGALRRMLARPEYQNSQPIMTPLSEAADLLRAVRQPVEASLEKLRGTLPGDPRRGDVFGAYPSKYTPASAIRMPNGQLRSWARAVDIGTAYDYGNFAGPGADEAWAAVLLRVRYLVTDCGEDATDPVAINLCLDKLRQTANLRLTPPD